MYMYIYICICIHTRIIKQRGYIQKVHIYAFVHAQAFVTNMYIYIFIYIHIYIHTYTYTNTHMQHACNQRLRMCTGILYT